jgi:hypothetical protein
VTEKIANEQLIENDIETEFNDEKLNEDNSE